MKLLCIDPGPKVSGVVVLHAKTFEVSSVYGEIDNDELVKRFPFTFGPVCAHLAIEAMKGSYGTVVGGDVVQTIIWTGRFMQAFGADRTTLVYRPDVKVALVDNQRANDAAIRQALIDRYEPMGGGKTPQVGTKKQQGPLYGVKKHAWAALAVGHTWVEQYGRDASLSKTA